MEARAVKRYSKGSPRKMRQVVDLVRNKSVQEAVGILRFSKHHSSDVVEKAVVSAYHNLENKLDTGRLDQGEVFISEIFVDGGPSYKRILPAPQGRAYRIRKRMAHLTVVVTNGEEEEVLEEEIPADEDVEENEEVVDEDTDDEEEESEEVEEIEDEEDENPEEEEKDDEEELENEEEEEKDEDETIENK